MWSEEKMPQRNPREWSALRPFKPLTQLVTGLIPRSNFDNVAGRSGTPEPALIGRAFAFTIFNFVHDCPLRWQSWHRDPQIRRAAL